MVGSQLFVLSLRGIPAFYLQAILGSENDLKTFRETGQRRDLNRERFHATELFQSLSNPSSIASNNLKNLQSAIRIRTNLKAFDPDSPMQCLSASLDDLVIICRGIGSQRIWAIHNFTDKVSKLKLLDFVIENDFPSSVVWEDCLTYNLINESCISIKPYSVLWLRPKREK